MSSALRTEQPSRNWWSLSSKSSKQDLNKQYASDKSFTSAVSKNSSGRGFPSFASVIGRKPKKHPTLTIQEPPSPLTSYPTSHPRQEIPPQFRPDLQSRSLLKSPQPLSPAESIELVTPVDGFREDRQSLLTLSDNDPFARGITVHASTSPIHLSTHSNSSFLDVSSKQEKSSLFVRGSYSSSSSQSHSPREPQHQSPNFLKVNSATAGTAEMRTLSSSKSLSNLQRKPSYADPEPPLPTGYHSQPNSRPPTRSRGMTESGPTRPPFLQETYAVTRQRRPSSPGKTPPSVSRGTTSPLLPSFVPGSQPSSRPSSRPPSAGHTTPNQLGSAIPLMKTQAISRQVSIQRLQPPTAPPTHELPAPPSKVTEESSLEDDLDIPPACDSSLSSSSLSFVSSLSSGMEVNRNSSRNKRQDSDLEQWSFVTNLRPEPDLDPSSIPSSSKLPLEVSTSPRTVGRPQTHGSPLKRHPPSQTSTWTSSESPTEATKLLRKQRSHNRLGIPPISLGFKHGHTVSNSTPSSPLLPEPSVPSNLDQRRGSTTSHASVPMIPVRKRVFSGSSIRRPSTSSGVPTARNEDDARSLFSVRSDQEFFTNASPFKPWPTSMSTLGSFWEDQAPPSPVHSDYLPQRIMSPEDLAKVEAELDDISIVSALPPPTIPPHSTRERTMSVSTVLSDRDSEIIPSSIFSQPFSESIKSSQMSVRSIKSTAPSLSEVGCVSGNSVGRTASMISKPSVAPQVNRRSTTTSGSVNLGPATPMSTIHEPEDRENSKAALISTSSPVTGDAISTTLISPLNIRKVQRKNSNASNTNPSPQLRSLPPPPRPRAKAEVVTVVDSQKNPSIEVRLEGGVRNSIGVDFGHGHRYGHAISPSIQSVSTNSGYYIPAPQAPSSSHNAPPIPPRAVSRPPPSYRRLRGVAPSVHQPSSSNSGESKVSRRMTLQRKPSFLEIDDDDDAEEDLDFHAIMRMSSASSSGVSFTRNDRTTGTESFLEFGRESLDTIRSAEFAPERF